MSSRYYDYPKTVADAALVLDAARPGWYNDVELEKLDMGSSSEDILGQVIGNYDRGMDLLFGNVYDRWEGLSSDSVFGCRASAGQWETEISKRKSSMAGGIINVSVGKMVTVSYAGQSIVIPITQLDALIAELQSLRVN